MISDRELYVDVIRKYQLDDICLGAEFAPKVNGDQPCTFMYHNNLVVDIFHLLNIYAKRLNEECFFVSV